MISFLKSFFSNEKTAEEQAVLASQALERQRDVMVVDKFAMDDAEEDVEDCAPQSCCGGGCHR